MTVSLNGNQSAGSRGKVLLGITGSIAAYKAAEVIRLLVTDGYTVRVVMTEAAQQFIGRVTIEALTGEPVLTSFWEEGKEIGHIRWADWADAVVVAPATADFLAKVTHGFADSPLLAICLATKAPIAVAPAMNVNMFEHPVTRENLAALSLRGVRIIEPGEGFLACGWEGRGRMAEPAAIAEVVRSLIGPHDLKGKKIVISAGPTRERIDPVRYISNRSSGKMGVALARAAARRGAEVRFIHGHLAVPVPHGVTAIPIESAEQLKSALQYELAHPPDAIIMAAAVADYRVAVPSESKMKRSAEPLELRLVPNTDILADLGARRQGALPLLVGFAVESGDEASLIAEAQRKLNAKRCDVVIANLAEDAFDSDTNRVWIVRSGAEPERIETAPKEAIAEQILSAIGSVWKRS